MQPLRITRGCIFFGVMMDGWKNGTISNPDVKSGLPLRYSTIPKYIVIHRIPLSPLTNPS